MRGDIPISVVVLTFNEEDNLAECLASVDDFDQVFVVDSHSSDSTRSIAEAAGAAVVEFTWNGRYPKKKQWSISNLPFRHDWVLFLDADERVTSELVAELRALLRDRQPAEAGFLIREDYVFEGRVLRHGHTIRKLSLLDRHRARYPVVGDLGATNMWEVEGHYQPELDGPFRELRGRMVHHDHSSLYEYFARHNRYSDWEAELLVGGGWSDSKGEALGGLRGRLKRASRHAPFRGSLAFLHSYVALAGFLDGRAGLDYALARGFYYWQIGLKRRELARTRRSPGLPDTQRTEADGHTRAKEGP